MGRTVGADFMAAAATLFGVGFELDREIAALAVQLIHGLIGFH